MANNFPLYVDLGQDLSMLIGVPTISTWVTEKRPTRVKRGTIGFNTETQTLEYWDGSAWYGATMVKG
jgi:hypothetical protein